MVNGIRKEGTSSEKSFEKIMTCIFCAICGLLMAALFCNSMRSSWINEIIWEELVVEREDLLWDNLAGLALGAVVCGGWTVFISKLTARFPAKDKTHLMAIITGIFCMLISAYWIYCSQTGPEADQRDVVEYAKAYANGDTSSLMKGGYVACYPQQLGLITFMRVLFLIFGQGNYKAYQYFNAGMIFLIVYSGYWIVRYLTRDNGKTEILYMLFMICCIPMYGYAPFVYGEIGSIALMLCAAALLFSIIGKFQWWKLFLLAISCGGMVQFRKNALICIIAFLIVLIVKWLQHPNRNMMYAVGGVLAGVIVFQMAISIIYAPFRTKDAKAIPMLVYVAMGTHYTPGIGAGWHDGYDLRSFREHDCDPESAVEAAKQDIRRFVEQCKADPKQLFMFYDMKLGSQWNAPMYQCLVMNSSFYGGPRWLAQQICFLGGSEYLECFMEIYQLFIYGGALLFLMLHNRTKEGIEDYVLLICVFGGFLFSIMWEAKTRYIFPYFMVMIPCAIAGLAELAACVQSELNRFWIKWRKR